MATLLVIALRNDRREGVDLADQARAANDWSHAAGPGRPSFTRAWGVEASGTPSTTAMAFMISSKLV